MGELALRVACGMHGLPDIEDYARCGDSAGHDQQVVLHGGDSRRGARRGRSRRARLLQRVHVSVSLAAWSDTSTLMWRASTSASRLNVSSIVSSMRAALGGGATVMSSVRPITPRTLRTMRLTSRRWYSCSTCPSRMTQPSSTRACTRPGGIWTQDVRDRGRDVRVVPRRAVQLDRQVVGYGLDPVDPFRGAFSGQLLGVALGMPGQGHRAVLDRYADGLGMRYLRPTATRG
jgi:hypothetical protein